MKSSSLNSLSLDSYKPSRFNIVVTQADRNPILYNSLSGARLSIPSDLLNDEQLGFLANGDAVGGHTPFSQDVASILIAHGLMVPVGVDEFALLMKARDDYSNDPQMRRVTVILTRTCNLGCTYCYQDKVISDAGWNPKRVLAYLKSQMVAGGLLQRV